MLTELTAGRYTLRGQSLGGLYTAFQVKELDAAFDAGVALRCAAASRNLFVSHAHADHLGALPALLGMRGLMGTLPPMRIFAPPSVCEGIPAFLEAFSVMHRWPFEVELVPMTPGSEFQLRRDLVVQAFKTHHRVPSLGYLFLERVQKLRAEFKGLPGAEIGRRRKAGEDLFETLERPGLAYATDTLPRVLDTEPRLRSVPTLILECTFYDDRKSVDSARRGGHIHLDELLPRVPQLSCDHLVLMHPSQLYKPDDVRARLAERWPTDAAVQPTPFLPEGNAWWA
jgi:ribonuclease Z